MSLAQTLKSRSNQAQQEALVELVIIQENVQAEVMESLNMTGLVLSEVKITSCTFNNVDFGGDQFYSCNIHETLFNTCDFTNSDLSDVVFTGVTFIDCTFNKCKFNGCSFDNCTFSDSNLSWTYHSLSKFTNGKVTNSYFNNAIISESTFLGTQLDNNQFLDAKIVKSKVDGHDLSAGENGIA